MSRKSIIVIVLVIIALLIGGLLGFYFYLHKNTNSEVGGLLRTNFFGLGNPTTPGTTPSTPGRTATSTPRVYVIPRLRHITLTPIAGADFVTKDISTTTATSTKRTPIFEEFISWIDRGTANIYSTATSTFTITRNSNTIVPIVYEGYFNPSGDSILIRTLARGSDTIQTQMGKIQTVSSTSTEPILKLTSLPLGLSNIAISPDKTSYFAITPGTPRGFISKWNGTSKTTIFDSPFHEWLADWPSSQAVVITTKPSGIAEGFAYIINTQTKSFTKLLGNKHGLTTLLSPDTNKLLYTESVEAGVELHVVNRKTSQDSKIYLKTFTDKCVWSKKENNIAYCAVPETLPYLTYPDAWYQGTVHFNDTLWKINTETGEKQQILTPSRYTDQALDMVNLKLSKNEDYLIFTNQIDLTLWGYQLIDKYSTSTATSTLSR